jgi:cytochrome b561
VALYVLLIALPLTAIVGAWLEGHPLTLFGIGNFGPMLPQSHDLGQSSARNREGAALSASASRTWKLLRLQSPAQAACIKSNLVF